MSCTDMTKQSFAGAAVLGAMLGMLCGVPAAAQNSVAPDNSKMNQSDRSAAAVTADQAKNDRADREIMKQIRTSILENKALSTYAHNIKIIAQHGKVTLKGPVHSEGERNVIEADAIGVAGAGNVTDQIMVMGDRSPK